MAQFDELQSIGHMSYDAFQGQYQKSAKSLTVNASFTWSKNINVGCADYWEGCNIQDPYHMRSNRGVDGVDVPIVLTASAVYELPFGKGKSFANQGPAAQILGGWKMNGLLGRRSGTPFTAGAVNNSSNAHTDAFRPNVTGSTSGPKTRAQWFNKAAFSQPAQYTFGDAGRNSLRGPAYTNMDYSLFREFAFRERYSIDFRTPGSNGCGQFRQDYGFERSSTPLPVRRNLPLLTNHLTHGAGGIHRRPRVFLG
jgi:hypothetical protein